MDSPPDRFGHPSLIGGPYKPAEGDQFDSSSGEMTWGKPSGGKMPRREHVLDWAKGGTRSSNSYGNWYGEGANSRMDTAYGYLTGPNLSNQGPHTFAHIGKRAMAESSKRTNKEFDPRKIKLRTAAIPSPGQARQLVRLAEEGEIASNPAYTPIPIGKKKALDKQYKAAWKAREDSLLHEKGAKAKKGKDATVELMELNPLSTYALGRPATDAELETKGERRGAAIDDLKLLLDLNQGQPLPVGLSVFDPGITGHRPAHVAQYGRSMGKLATGRHDDLSDLEASSDDEYL